MRRFLCVAIAGAVGCGGRGLSDRMCSVDDDCLKGGVVGACLPSPLSGGLYCAFGDGTCPSGYRWGLRAEADLDETCVDSPGFDAAEMTCADDLECPEALPFCTEGGSCVACRTSADCGDPTLGACDQGQCRGCQADGECWTGVCDEAAARCIDLEDLLFVDAVLGTPGPCSRDAPCATIQEAIDQASVFERWIVIANGDYEETIRIEDGSNLHLVGQGATVLPGPTEIGIDLVALSSEVTVVVEGLRIYGAQRGVSCYGLGGVAKGVLTIVGSAIQASEAHAVYLTDCEVVLDGSSVTDNAQGLYSGPSNTAATLAVVRSTVAGTLTGPAVHVEYGSLLVSQSSIAFNGGPGVVTSQSSFMITNNFIVGNGPGRAVLLGAYSGTEATGFDFNSVTANVSDGGTNAGVRCDLGPSFVMTHNIIRDNGVGTSPQQVDGTCVTHYSNIGPQTEGGLGNLNVPPMFVDVDAGDLHLMPGSQLRDRGNPKAAPGIDIDGDARPQGDVVDVGADEIR